MRQHLLWFVASALLLAAPNNIGAETKTEDAKPIVLPTEYREHRFYVTPVTEDGQQLTLATDTGGGQSFIYRDAAERLQLTIEDFKGTVGRLKIPIPPSVESKAPGVFAEYPRFEKEAEIPPTLTPWGPLPVLAVRTRVDGERSEFGDGFLGGNWFNGRVWTFDYPGHRLLLRPSGDLPRHPSAQRVPLGFKTEPDGSRSANYPRIGVKIAERTLEMLFDTGASTKLTDSALRELADGRPRSLYMGKSCKKRSTRG